jgi:preprotein translocase subunit YajC
MNDVAALFSKAFDCLIFGFIMLDFFWMRIVQRKAENKRKQLKAMEHGEDMQTQSICLCYQGMQTKETHT